jgi:DNA-binding response OmpR family regulator
MAARKILIVEDDQAIRRGLSDALRFAGFEPLEAGTFAEAMESAVRSPCDLMLLDLVLPGGDGLAILAEARMARPTLPVIIVTSRGQEDERVEGLNLGADDYVVKPYSVKEMLARIEAVLRRSAERPLQLESISFPGGTVDFRRLELRFDDGQREEISERESELLRYLAQNRGRAISRDELLARVWRLPSSAVRTRTIDMHVARLREKLRDSLERPRVILTVRGRGYMLAASAQ